MIKKVARLKGSVIIPMTAAVLFFSSSCSPLFLSPKNIEIKEHLTQAEELINQGKFDRALKEYEWILEKYSKNPWLDKVLYDLGCLFAFPDNPRRNLARAKTYFQSISREFARSSYYKEAQVWLALLLELQLKENEIARMEKEVSGNEEEIIRLKQMINTLKTESSVLLGSLSQEILQKEQQIDELEKKLLAQEIALGNLQDQMKKIKDIDIKLEKKKKDVKE